MGLAMQPVPDTMSATLAAGGSVTVVTTIYEYPDDPPGLAVAAQARLRANVRKQGGKVT